MEFHLLEEVAFEQSMKSVVEPYLAGVRESGHLPYRSGSTPTIMNRGQYWEFYAQKEQAPTIVISHGFTESVKKYYELIYYFHKAGYQVAIAEHRGHGLSGREVEDADTIHVSRFMDYVDDFHYFYEQVVRLRRKSDEIYLFAHSMGGCIGALYLEKYPQDMKKAVLNAPMLGINSGNVPESAMLIGINTALMLGKGKQPAAVTGPFDPNETMEQACNDSKARHDYYLEIRRKNKIYQSNRASYNWIAQSAEAGKLALRKDNLKKVKAPVLLFQALRDTLVLPGPQEKFVEQIEGAKLQVIDSRHEIYIAENEVLKPYLDTIFDFYQDTL